MVSTPTGKLGGHFPVREKSGNFTQNTRKSKEFLHKMLEKFLGKSYFYFFSDLNVGQFLFLSVSFNLIVFKNTGKWRKILEKSGKFVTVRRCGNHDM